MKKQLYQWIKTNGIILINTGSLIGTTAVTGVLGFAYWWVAARLYSPQAVGLASAAISAMMLLGAICVLGLGTLLIGELPRRPGKRASLISAALILVGGVGACGGIVFALVAPLVSTDFQPLRASIGNILLFAVGVSLTAIVIVLDKAFIGLLQANLQLWRNTVFALAKLVLLILAGFLLLRVGETVYGTWAAGNLLSLIPLAGLAAVKGGKSVKAFMPDWKLLRQLGVPALEHHMLNLILQAPTTALPVLVTVLLSATVNAWFYVSWMLCGLVTTASYALTTVLYAINSTQTSELTRKLRVTLILALVTSLLANCLLQFGATEILGLFGPAYAQQASWSLRILSLGAFPMIIKDHYIAVSRIHSKMARVAFLVALGSLLELGVAALGARLGGLAGLSLGWVLAVYVEAVFMFPAVYKVAFPVHAPALPQVKQILTTNHEDKTFKHRLCTSCNTIVPTQAHFCSKCGEKLDKNIKTWFTLSFLGDVAGVLFPLCAIVIWSLSLPAVNIGRMTDLGLVSVLPASIIIALIILIVSYCVALNRPKLRVSVLLLHLVLLIFMLYGITTLVEEAPRFAIVYRHAGYAEYIMRTGTIDPYLDAYFNWSGFFILSAFLTPVAGYHDILGYAAWAPVFFNLIYLGPLYVILSTATTDKRIVWLGLLFFYLTNWIAQDYFSPQGFDFFLYLVIIAILLKWFKKPAPTMPRRPTRRRHRLGQLYGWLTAPDTLVTPVQPRQRRVLLASVVVIFALIIFSHPLTPFPMIMVVTALVVFGRITPRWLPILMGVMIAVWDIFMAQPYFAGHLAMLLSDVGQLQGALTSDVTSRVLDADPEHTFIGEMRLIMTLFIWGLAFVGGVFRLRRGYRDASYVLLAVVPFPLLLLQTYGGEMLLRIYFFTLPAMVFFAAALFYSVPAKNMLLSMKTGYRPASFARAEGSVSARRISLLMKVMVGVVSVVLLGGFLFTRYGNERMDYMTNAEVAGVHQLYNRAPKGSMLIAGWGGTPWQFQDFEQYDLYVLSDDLSDAVVTRNVGPVVQLIENKRPPRAYLIFTRSQKATAQIEGLPPGMLDQFEHALLTSRKFVLVYSNVDAQIFLFTGGGERGSP